MRYKFIAQHKKAYPIYLLCELLAVSRRSYFDFVKKKKNGVIHREKVELIEEVKAIAQQSYHSYGTRRISEALGKKGYQVGRYQARSLMKEAGTSVKKKKSD